MAVGVDLRCPTVGHSRSTRVTRGEPRPVHITLIATSSHLSAGVYVLKFQAVIPRITPGPPRGVKTLRRLNQRFCLSRGNWGGVCRARQPAQKHKSEAPPRPHCGHSGNRLFRIPSHQLPHGSSSRLSGPGPGPELACPCTQPAALTDPVTTQCRRRILGSSFRMGGRRRRACYTFIFCTGRGRTLRLRLPRALGTRVCCSREASCCPRLARRWRTDCDDGTSPRHRARLAHVS